MDTRRLLTAERDLPWLPKPNRASLYACGTVPPTMLVTSSFVLAFHGGKVLLVDVRARSGRWDPPGGHVEPTETPADAAVREALEEAGAVVVDVEPIAYQEITLEGAAPPEYPYPFPTSYQLFCVARIEHLGTFEESEEVVARGLFTRDEAISLPWGRGHSSLVDLAWQRARRSGLAD